MQIKTPTFEWLAKIKNGKIKIPKEAFEAYPATLKEGELVYVQIAIVGEIVK